MIHPFAVWAPNARRVAVVVDGHRVPMTRRDERGWWDAMAAAAPGSRYGFSLDEGPLRPDPRSPSQPDGVHGLSEVIDQLAFDWNDDTWPGTTLAGSVLYELHVGTYSAAGTFDGVVEHLEHLVGLGIDVVELMPVVEFPGSRGWGYDGVDLFAPHHAYGGPDGLKRLVDACHRAGLGVVFDVVYNHLGPSGNYLDEFGPYFTDKYRTAWGRAVNVDDQGSDEVRRFIVDNAVMWLRDYHGDGLRLDATHAIVDTSARHILEQLAVAVDELAAHVGRPLFLVAESDRNDPMIVRDRDVSGFGLAASWADEWHHALHTVLTGERAGYYEDFGSMATLGKALRQAWVHDGTFSKHRGRVHGRPPEGVRGDRFVIETQNHDQVGNRAAGDRLTTLTTDGRVKVAAALLLTAPFTPLLFMGEEWGARTPFLYFTDHDDPELGAAVSNGRRHEFAAFGCAPDDVPDPQEPATFERSKLRWDELDDHRGVTMLEWYRQLVALRHDRPDLRDGRLDRVDVAAADDGLVIVGRGHITVVANVGAENRTVPREGRHLLLASEPTVVVTGDVVTVPVDTVAILAHH